jgi:sulfane dehydrogenase subunit SoxC
MAEPDNHPPVTSRRRFLRGAVAGGIAAGSLGGEARAETGKGADNLPPNVPEWMKTPGDPIGSQLYGMPSEHEKNVVRNIPKNAAQLISAASRSPLQDLDGIITPNGLFYERHHGGIPNIDPAQHRLILHSLVDQAADIHDGGHSPVPLAIAHPFHRMLR